ncbi:unnamed protein product, partial [Prunus brigantina]
PCIGCSERDRQALLALKQGLVGDDGDRLLSWGREAENRNCCQWEGVYCSSNQTGHVVKLDLEDQSLRGKISPELVKLQHLEYLNLRFNNLSQSQIPDFIGSLSNLRHLDLSSANFGGQIPNQLGNLTHLQYLDLSSHYYSVIRPRNSIHAQNLNWLPNLSGLKHLDLSHTNLSDVVGWLEAVNMLPKLTNLTLDGCNLPPPIISSVSLMNSSNSLVHVDLFRNNLNSSIFQWLSGTHTNLVYLDLSRNNFRGSSIPASFGNMSSLEYLILRGSKLEGGFPNSFAKLCRLRRLDLYGNRHSGQLTNFVEILSECVQNTLEHLDISYNKDIVGSLPDLTNFLSLKHLNLEANNLSGRIPESIGQMSKLETIDLGASLPNLAILILRGNQFYRSIPPQICHLTRIQILDLSMNNISGTIPKCLNNLIVLAQNGNSSLTIEHLYITPIPSEITDLVGLVSLNLSRNQLTCQIPPRIGMLQELDSLDLSRNQIDGRIPNSRSRIDRIGYLDLSENDFSGKIPIGTQLQSFGPSSYGGNPLLCGLPLLRTCDEDEEGPRQTVLVNQDDQDGLITQGFYISLGLGFAVGFWGVFGTLLFNSLGTFETTCFPLVEDGRDEGLLFVLAFDIWYDVLVYLMVFSDSSMLFQCRKLYIVNTQISPQHHSHSRRVQTLGDTPSATIISKQIDKHLQLITSSSEFNLTITPSIFQAFSTSNMTVLSPFPTT